MENPAASHDQLRRAVRRVLFHVRQGEPAQPARERHLAADGFDDAARRLCALLHAAAAGKRVRRATWPYSTARAEFQPGPSDAGQRGQGRARELFRRRHFAKNHQAPASRPGRLLQKRRGNSSTTDCSGRRSSSRRSITPRAGFMAWNSPALTTTAAFPAYANLAWSVGAGQGLELGAIPV